MEYIALGILVLAILFVVLSVRIVPQQKCYIVERLGKYDRTLDAGLHLLIPFLDRVAHELSMKEIVLDIPSQICITRDNVQVHVDGVVFYRIMDAKLASYGVNQFELAIMQLAQTTLRSEIGKIDLDRTFLEREKINNALIIAIDAATQPWGVKVLRYEIKSINPPKAVLEAMEKQMRAEREKRARILESEGNRDSQVNNAEGHKQDVIKQSEADKQRQINQAYGQAEAITAIAQATADGIRRVADALNQKGGHEAANYKVAEEYVKQLGNMATNSDLLIVPANVADPTSILSTAYGVFEKMKNRNQSD